MPRYDDRYGSTRLYVGRLASRTRTRDLEYLFSRYGRIREVELKRDYAFIEYSDPRDADDARYNLDGRDVDGSRIIVEFAKGVPRGSGSSREREYVGRGPAPGTGRCFNCGIDGHWARDCRAGDWKNKCYRCGERGHIERNCQNSPRSTRRERSYSRSPSPRRGRARSRSYSRSRSRSYSRSRSRSFSESPRGCRLERDARSRSVSYSRSPRRSLSPEAKEMDRSLTPDRSRSPRRSLSPEAKGNGASPRGRDMSRSPSDGYRSPVANGRSPSPRVKDGSRSPTNKGSPSPTNKGSPSPRGDNGSPSPRGNGDGGSPSLRGNGDGDDRDASGSPRGSMSP
ncbi:unnamed protein product [Alopecurus aequalis]